MAKRRRHASTGSIEQLLAAKEIVIHCGSGGVGKTTTAAAMALRAAEYGRTVVVLTIDPAKRLAQALGIKDLGNTPGHVNHWSKRGFEALLSRHGEVVETRSPFPWTMTLVKVS